MSDRRWSIWSYDVGTTPTDDNSNVLGSAFALFALGGLLLTTPFNMWAYLILMFFAFIVGKVIGLAL